MAYRSSARELPPSGLVVIGQYLDTVSANLARARLETEGIRAFVTEAMSSNPLWNVAAGGTTLSVGASSEEAARAVLEQMRREAAADDDDNDADVRCPRCELEYCFEELGVGGKHWRCRKCDHVFYDRDEGPKRRTALPEGESPPVFRLRRSNRGVGLFIGIVAGAVGAMAIGGAGAVIMLVLGGLAGYWLGGAMTADVCSEPACRTPLSASATSCPGCRGELHGVIFAASEHHTESAKYRRSLVELRPRKKKRKKSAELVE